MTAQVHHQRGMYGRRLSPRDRGRGYSAHPAPLQGSSQSTGISRRATGRPPPPSAGKGSRLRDVGVAGWAIPGMVR